MRISIDVPEVVCARCGAQVAQVPMALQTVKSGVGEAVDNRGNSWRLTSKLPSGWQTCGADQKLLCGECAKLWQAAADAFFGKEPPPEPAEPLSWAEAEAQRRARVGAAPLAQLSVKATVAPIAERAEVQRPSNIPQVAGPPVQTNLQRRLVQPPLSASNHSSLPTHAPCATAIANTQLPPKAVPTVVTAQASPPPSQGGRVTRSTTSPMSQPQASVRAVTSSIPVPPEQRTGVSAWAAPPIAAQTREAPVPQAPERADVRVRADRVLGARDAGEAPRPVHVPAAASQLEEAPAAQPAIEPAEVEYGAAGESVDDQPLPAAG